MLKHGVMKIRILADIKDDKSNLAKMVQRFTEASRRCSGGQHTRYKKREAALLYGMRIR
jgi:hypothetical protein